MQREGADFETLLLASVGCSSATPPPAPFTTYQHALATIDTSSSIILSAYMLSPNSRVTRHLAQAAARGAHVHVVLTGEGFGYALRDNRQTAALLTKRGVRVQLSDYPLHMKSLIGDHDTIVTDTNFTARGLYVELPAGARATVYHAILGHTGFYGGFTTDKASSLRVEAAALASTTGPITIESESFSDHNPVFDVLLVAIARHRSVEVLANADDAAHSASFARASSILGAAGVHVHLVRSDEKLAVSNSVCWAGSSNSSRGLESQVDWGLRLDNAAACTWLAQRIERNRS